MQSLRLSNFHWICLGVGILNRPPILYPANYDFHHRRPYYLSPLRLPISPHSHLQSHSCCQHMYYRPLTANFQPSKLNFSNYRKFLSNFFRYGSQQLPERYPYQHLAKCVFPSSYCCNPASFHFRHLTYQTNPYRQA